MSGVKSESIIEANVALQAARSIKPEVQERNFAVLTGQSDYCKSTALRAHADLKETSSAELATGADTISAVAPTNRDFAMTLPNPIFIMDDGRIGKITVFDAEGRVAHCRSARTSATNPQLQSATTSQLC
jgi:hypothetical protein